MPHMSESCLQGWSEWSRGVCTPQRSRRSPEILKRWFSEGAGKKGRTLALSRVMRPRPGEVTRMSPALLCCLPRVPWWVLVFLGGCPSAPVAWNGLYIIWGILTPNAENSQTQMQLLLIPTLSRLSTTISVAPVISNLKGKRIKRNLFFHWMVNRTCLQLFPLKNEGSLPPSLWRSMCLPAELSLRERAWCPNLPVGRWTSTLDPTWKVFPLCRWHGPLVLCGYHSRWMPIWLSLCHDHSP